MLIAQVQFSPWDKAYNFSVNTLNLSVGDKVIVDTEFGKEFGKIISLFEEEMSKEVAADIKPVIRVATESDLKKVASEEKKEEAKEFCEGLIKKHELPMKLTDVHFSFEAKRMNFAFISENRVDFRELVKDIASHFNANIRLTQIGARDEARACGDCGPCGRKLCCKGHQKDFSSITSEMAEVQQVVHRGSERISGMCGRLMCCLSHEYEGYKELAAKLPPIGAKVNADGIRGEVIGQHVLKQTVDIRIRGDRNSGRDSVVTIDINRHKKKK